MPLSGTFNLNEDCVIVGASTPTGLTPVGDTAIGEIIAEGSNVTDWSVGDVVMYDSKYAKVFKNNETTFTLIREINIFFSYEAEPEP